VSSVSRRRPMIRNYPGFPHGISGHDSPAGRASRPGCSARTWCSPSPWWAWRAGAGSGSCISPMATGSPPGRSSWRPASPGAAWACRAWKRWSAPGSFTARPGVKRDVAPDGSHPSRWPLDRAPLPLETSVPGVFAAGDARYRSIKRVASAVGDGATAVRLVQEYLSVQDAAEPPAASKGMTR
jgi:hypothetical protein